MPVLFLPRRPPYSRLRSGPFVAASWGNASSVSLVSAPNAGGGYIAITPTNVGGDHNEIWRYTSGTGAVRLTKTLPIGGTFRDYATASGVTYFYFARAVNADGSYLDSTVLTDSVTLEDPWLFAITKGATSNLSGDALALKAIEPQSRPVSRTEVILFPAGRTKPIIATGDIVTKSWSVTVLSINLLLVDQLALEALAALRRTLCIRDCYGRIMFGTIRELPTSYGINTAVSLTLTQTDYHLHVA